jgi:hypothetical protein
LVPEAIGWIAGVRENRNDCALNPAFRPADYIVPADHNIPSILTLVILNEGKRCRRMTYAWLVRPLEPKVLVRRLA